MKKQSDYFKLLKHPKWQEKRLEIMNRALFECEHCGTKEETLNVHHMYYEKNKKPWEYPDDCLHCLCIDCHKAIQQIQDKIKIEMSKLMFGELGFLLGYIKGMQSRNFPMVELTIGSYEEIEGIANCWDVKAELIKEELKDNQINGYKLFYIKHGRSVGEPSS